MKAKLAELIRSHHSNRGGGGEGASRVAHFFNSHVSPPVPPLRELSIRSSTAGLVFESAILTGELWRAKYGDTPDLNGY